MVAKTQGGAKAAGAKAVKTGRAVTAPVKPETAASAAQVPAATPDASVTPRERLEALKARRMSTLTSSVAAARPAAAEAGATVPGRKRRGAKAAGGGAGAAGAGVQIAGLTPARIKAMFSGPNHAPQRRALMRAIRIMTDTPDDGTGSVRGTPFSRAGVAKLISTLKNLSDSPQNGRAASMLLRLVTADGPATGGQEEVHGVPVIRLVQLAKLAEFLRKRLAGQGGGGGAF